MPRETRRLLGSTEKVIAKDTNAENVPKLEIVDVILMHCNVVNKSYEKASKVSFSLYLINNLDNNYYLDLSKHGLQLKIKYHLK